MEDRDDEAFLADLNGFLHEFQLEVSTVNPVTDLLQDSDKLLAETKAFLASYDANAIPFQQPIGNATVESQKTMTDEKREVQNAQAAKRRLKYRNKLKNERQQLIEQEQFLSEKLSQLQHDRKKVKVMQKTSVSMPLWKAIASRQMDGRMVAEEQQRRLNCAIANRMKLIQEVDEIMRQQLCKVETSATREMTTESNTCKLEPDDITLFEEYLQDMDVVYKQTDEVFRAFGVEKTLRPHTKWTRNGNKTEVGNFLKT